MIKDNIKEESTFKGYLSKKYPEINFEQIISIFIYELFIYMRLQKKQYIKLFSFLKAFLSGPNYSVIKFQINQPFINISSINKIISMPSILKISIDDSTILLNQSLIDRMNEIDQNQNDYVYNNIDSINENNIESENDIDLNDLM